MILRAAADGDEYDKDVASAIRYAVDNGAKVINMSLGKYTSPQADMVNEAIAYAASRTCLSSRQPETTTSMWTPSPIFHQPSTRRASASTTFSRVGASDAQGRLSSFSNYGATHVDVLAPGETITTVMPGNEYAPVDGTSISAPIVSGWRPCSVLTSPSSKLPTSNESLSKQHAIHSKKDSPRQESSTQRLPCAQQ